MARTKDKSFNPCPVCGRMPHVGTYPMNYGWAWCNGGLFVKHKKIRVEIGYHAPYSLISDLAYKWNDRTYKIWYKYIWPKKPVKTKSSAKREKAV